MAQLEELEVEDPPTPTAGTSPAAGTGTPPVATPRAAASFKPAEPKRGRLDQTGPDTWIPWTGGKPTGDWMSLEDPNPAIQPNWYRPSSVQGLTKSQYYRVEGLETKITKEGNLIAFQRLVLAKLEKYAFSTLTTVF